MSFSPQGSCFQKSEAYQGTLLNESTPSNTLAWQLRVFFFSMISGEDSGWNLQQWIRLVPRHPCKGGLYPGPYEGPEGVGVFF